MSRTIGRSFRPDELVQKFSIFCDGRRRRRRRYVGSTPRRNSHSPKRTDTEWSHHQPAEWCSPAPLLPQPNNVSLRRGRSFLRSSVQHKKHRPSGGSMCAKIGENRVGWLSSKSLTRHLFVHESVRKCRYLLATSNKRRNVLPTLVAGVIWIEDCCTSSLWTVSIVAAVRLDQLVACNLGEFLVDPIFVLISNIEFIITTNAMRESGYVIELGLVFILRIPKCTFARICSPRLQIRNHAHRTRVSLIRPDLSVIKLANALFSARPTTTTMMMVCAHFSGLMLLLLLDSDSTLNVYLSFRLAVGGSCCCCLSYCTFAARVGIERRRRRATNPIEIHMCRIFASSLCNFRNRYDSLRISHRAMFARACCHSVALCRNTWKIWNPCVVRRPSYFVVWSVAFGGMSRSCMRVNVRMPACSIRKLSALTLEHNHVEPARTDWKLVINMIPVNIPNICTAVPSSAQRSDQTHHRRRRSELEHTSFAPRIVNPNPRPVRFGTRMRITYSIFNFQCSTYLRNSRRSLIPIEPSNFSN